MADWLAKKTTTSAPRLENDSFMISFVPAASLNPVLPARQSHLPGRTTFHAFDDRWRLLNDGWPFGNRNNTYTYDYPDSFNWTRGSTIQVLLHWGHFDGFVSLAAPNSKPHFRQRAGSMTAEYAVCLRLLSTCSKSVSMSRGVSPTRRAIWETDSGLPSSSGMRSLRNTRQA